MFVGRASELAVLSEAAAGAQAGRGRLVLLSGEAGMGKTALLEHFTGLSQDRATVWASCWEEVGQPPYWVWTQVLRSLAGDTQVPLPWVAEGGKVPVSPFMAHDAVVGALRAAGGPLTVCIDDVQWADSASVACLVHLSRCLRDLPVLVLVTRRDADPSLDDVQASALADLVRTCTVVELSGLSTADVAELLGSGGADDQDARRIFEHTRGNALFVTELARSPRGGFDADDPLPARLSVLLNERLARLSNAAREVLEVAAVLGQQSDLNETATLLSLSAEQAVALVGDALTLRLAGLQEGMVSFTHALVRRAVLDSLPLVRRVSLHADCYQLLSGKEHALARAAQHGLRGLPIVRPEDVASTCLQAGRAARAAAAPRAAAELLAQAVRLTGPGQASASVHAALELELGVAWREAGDQQRALAAFAAAEERASSAAQPQLAAQALVERALTEPLFAASGDLDLRIRQLLALVPPASVEAERLQACLWLRRTANGRAEPEADQWVASAVAAAEERGDVPALGRLLPLRQELLSRCDQLARRREVASRYLELADSQDDLDMPYEAGFCQLVIGLEGADRSWLQAGLGRLVVAAARSRQPRHRMHVLTRQTLVAHLEGRDDDAFALLEQTEQFAEQARLPEFVPGTAALSVLLHLDCERIPPPAYVELLLAAKGSPLLATGGALVGALAAQEQGNLDEATWSELVSCAPLDPAQLMYNGLARATLLGRIAARRGDAGIVESIMHHLEPYGGQVAVIAGSVAAVAPVALVQAELALHLGRDSDAHRYARRANAVATALKAMPWQRQANRLIPATQPLGPRLTRQENSWLLTTAEGTLTLADGKGMAYLTALLAAPHRELSAQDLAAGQAGWPDLRPAADLGPALDEQAKRDYRQRMIELRDHADRADARGDAEASMRALDELEALRRELARAIGLTGRDRPQGSSSERARLNVSRAVRSSIARITQTFPALGHDLDRSIRTGGRCCYTPIDDAIWRIEQEPPQCPIPGGSGEGKNRP